MRGARKDSTSSDRKGSSHFVNADANRDVRSPGTATKYLSSVRRLAISPLIDILDRVQGNSNMSLAISQRARAAVRRNQLLSRSMLSLVRQRGPIRWVSAVPGQKPGSDQYVHFILEGAISTIHANGFSAVSSFPGLSIASSRPK
jgi:hypothetical protein